MSKPVQLTTGGKAQRFGPTWSPDNSRIAFSDKDGKLFVVRLADKNVTEVAHDRGSRIGDYTWAPIGNALAWSMTDSDEASLRCTSGRRRRASCTASRRPRSTSSIRRGIRTAITCTI